MLRSFLVASRFSRAVVPALRRPLSSSPANPSWPYDNRPLNETEKEKALKRDADLRATYDAVLSTYPEHAQPTDGSKQVDKLEAYRKRLVYRSKQRGWCVRTRCIPRVFAVVEGVLVFTGWKLTC